MAAYHIAPNRAPNNKYHRPKFAYDKEIEKTEKNLAILKKESSNWEQIRLLLENIDELKVEFENTNDQEKQLNIKRKIEGNDEKLIGISIKIIKLQKQVSIRPENSENLNPKFKGWSIRRVVQYQIDEIDDSILEVSNKKKLLLEIQKLRRERQAQYRSMHKSNARYEAWQTISNLNHKIELLREKLGNFKC